MPTGNRTATSGSAHLRTIESVHLRITGTVRRTRERVHPRIDTTAPSDPRTRTLAPSHSRTRTFALSHPRPLAPYFLLFFCLLPFTLFAQDSGDAQRIAERIRSLQQEAERLAGEAKTLVGALRKREIERDIKVAQLEQAEVAMREAERALQETTTRLSDLEAQRVNQLRDLEAQLVDVYKRGRSGYARLLFTAGDLRELARATRAVGALSAINQRRIDAHRRTLEAVRRERTAFEQKARDLRATTAEARRAQEASDRAVASASELITQIDSRRDLTAQYVGELQEAYTRLQQQVTALSAGTSPAAAAVPLRPFQGALDWPVPGRTVGPFGQPSSRLGGSVARNGVEIAADEDAAVRAIHGGTVGFAGPFEGFGTLVILDHGNDGYSLYGYLSSTPLTLGETVRTGAEVGRVGLAPAGPPTLYFELRIDGRPVNPVQWLKPR
jgi:septal ring factor EnvC (AmiA/AmiB activator)